MKKIKLAIGIIALSVSAGASAMPEQVSPNWWGNMQFRLGVMGDNPGFCRHFTFVPICQI